MTHTTDAKIRTTMLAIATLLALAGCLGKAPGLTQPVQARALDIDLVDASVFGMPNIPAEDGGLSGMAVRAPLKPPMQILVWSPIGPPVDEEGIRAAMATAGLELGPSLRAFVDSPPVDGTKSISVSIGAKAVATSWNCDSSGVRATLFTIARQNDAMDSAHLRSLSTAKCAPEPPPVPTADVAVFTFSMADFERQGDSSRAVRYVRDSDHTTVRIGATPMDSRLTERPSTCAGALFHAAKRVKEAAGISHGKEEALPVASGCASQTAEPDDPIHATFAVKPCSDGRVLHIEIVANSHATDRAEILEKIGCSSG